MSEKEKAIQYYKDLGYQPFAIFPVRTDCLRNPVTLKTIELNEVVEKYREATKEDLISSLQSENERLKKEKDENYESAKFWVKAWNKLKAEYDKAVEHIEVLKDNGHGGLQAEIERLKSSKRSKGHFQREDLNPEFLKTIDGINEKLFGKTVGEDKKESFCECGNKVRGNGLCGECCEE